MPCPVSDHFSRQSLNASSEWISACKDWCSSEASVTSEKGLIQACYQQWLATDIRGDGVQREAARNQFPLDDMKSQLKVVLPAGSYSVQVQAALDIGHAGYDQLKTLNRVKDDNSKVDSDIDSQRPYTAAWEPKPKRMLKFSLTNGYQTVGAIEHQPISDLQDPVKPGTKLTLFGPLTVRRGLILLTPKNLKVRGGFVDEMKASFALKKVLNVRLQKAAPEGDCYKDSVSSLPLQTYVPRDVPIKYKPGQNSGRTALSSLGNRAVASRAIHPSTSNSLSDVFNDTDDEFLASMDIPEAGDGNQNQEDVFDDEDDELFSQIEMPGGSASSTPRYNIKRRKT